MPDQPADQIIRTAIIGASGYTGADFIRLAQNHPNIEITALVANTHAGKQMDEVFPHLTPATLPPLVTHKEVDWQKIEAVICGLPHGTAQDIIGGLPDHLKIIDMSADFRLRNPDTYEAWYDRSHDQKDLLKEAAYGLTEHNREDIRSARIIACPGCYPTAALMALIPLVSKGLIEPEEIILDAKSGVSGAGRGLKQNLLFCEAGEGLSPYAIGKHRHTPEIEQELKKAAGLEEMAISFTPHLVPMSRGELITCHLKLAPGKIMEEARSAFKEAYDHEPFIHLVKEGVAPATQYVRGSNHCQIGLFAASVKGRIIVISAIDNLVKGSAGQALQNFNLAFGLEETTGLTQLSLFP